MVSEENGILKDLINQIIAAFEAAIVATTLDASRIFKGFQNSPHQIARKDFPYISVDEGGEETTEEGVDSSEAIQRIYHVEIEMAVWKNNIQTSLDNILDFSNQAKAVLELPANRFKDSHVWGINITPFDWVVKEKFFFRGRHIIVDYMDLEDKPFQY